MPDAQEPIKTTTPDNTETTAATEGASQQEPPAATAASSETSSADDKNKESSLATPFAIAAFIIALSAFGAGFMAWQQIGDDQNNLSGLIEETGKSVASLQATADTSKTIANAVQHTNELLEGRLENLENELNNSVGKLQESDSALNSAVDNLSEALRASKSDDWRVAEARHLINIAHYQAQLNNNLDVAIAALETADKRLRDSADPSLLKARQAITDDIVALRGVGTIDVSGMAMTLSKLEQEIEQLPLRQKKGEESASESGETVSDGESFLHKIWNDIKNLVSVRRNSEEQLATALLPPGQRFFLQQNLRLKLETARLALLQHDTQTLRDSLATAAQWLERYFDSSAAGANMLATLAEYQNVELVPALPDFSAALRALDEWRKQQSGGKSDTTAAEVTTP